MYKGIKTVLQISGMKDRKWLQENVLPNIVNAVEKLGVTIHCKVCMGGAGLQPTRLLKHPEAITWVVNDIDEEKANLYHVIKDYRFKLENACDDILNIIQSIIKNNEIHESDRYLDVKDKIMEIIPNELAYPDDVKVAALTILSNCHSSRGTTYTVKEQLNAFHKKSDNICKIHELFHSCKSVKIINDDLLNVIKLYKRKRNVILWIDPPYYLSNGNYSENRPEHMFHDEIAELLIKAKCRFALFLRIKASRASGKDVGNQAIDDTLVSFYDNHYAGKNFYYKDMPVNQKGVYTTERVITNFAFDGCFEYK